MNRITLPALTLSLALATALDAAPRHPMAEKAEATFFDSFNASPDSVSKRDAAIGELTTAYAIDPTDPATALHLGLAHLWTAAESGGQDPSAIPHLVLAERFLTRAQDLAPGDQRIPSWLVPARLSLASIERQKDRQPALYAALVAAYKERPAFHSFSLALVSSHEPKDSPRFQAGLKALRDAATECADATNDRACGNAPRWPHNVEGFLLFRAEMEAKAGSVDAAKATLTRVAAQPSYESWTFRKQAEELRAALDGSGEARTSLFEGRSRVSCQVCHRK